MAETHLEVVKVWIAPGCIVCDSCENDCPEVFDVQEETCVIRPPALSVEFTKPLTPSIVVAAEGCPVDVIKFETVEIPGEAPWAGQEQQAAAPAAGGSHGAAPKKEVAMSPPDPRWQALLSTSKVSDSLSAGPITTRTRSEIIQGEQIVRAVALPRNAPPDQRAAILAAGGAYAPSPTLAQRIRASNVAAPSRRAFNIALAIAWGMIAFCGATCLAMFQDFFGPKVLKEPKKVWRVGRLEDFRTPHKVDETFKRTPDGGTGFWLVNLQPDEERLVALSTICTHLGCIPNWLQGDQKFKCPCHGSGYYITGVNFEGPTPRPLERFAIAKDADGWINVDMTRIYRSEMGEWDNTESFLAL